MSAVSYRTCTSRIANARIDTSASASHPRNSSLCAQRRFTSSLARIVLPALLLLLSFSQLNSSMLNVIAQHGNATQVVPLSIDQQLASLNFTVEQQQPLATDSRHDSTPLGGKPGTNAERSFLAVKPDGVQRGIVGEIIKRFEAKGFKLVGLKMIHATKEMAESHYADHKGKPFFAGLVSFFTSGPIVCMVWEGQDVILTGRKMMGATKPKDSAPGTIRGDLCVDMGRNIIHGSDGPESAVKEIGVWFKEGEVFNWTPASAKWIYE